MPFSAWISDLFAVVLHLLYALGALGLAIYGGQALWLTWQRRRPPRTVHAQDSDMLSLSDWPSVTVQLPIFNEQHVVERLIDACARLDYPHHRLQIQVLDDSTDDTTSLARRRAALWRQQGVNVQVIHRQDRTGYKAGALAQAMSRATGEFLAIFDADFVPPADFLRRAIPHFLSPANQRIGFVQARWGHLNPLYSPLTRAQALALDGHFVVEQAARQVAGYPFGFNGSAGVWRRACIEDVAVGGWHADTLCEDLDLSYRAQLAGWQPRYLDDLEVPAEVPPQLLAFKRQQFRWAKGSVQTLLKLGRRVWRSDWPLSARLAALCHLGNYLIHPLLLLLLLVTLPLLLLDLDPSWPLAYLSLVSLGPPLLYAEAQRRLYPRDWLRRWAYLPVLTLLGTGLCLSNSLAVWQAILGKTTPFLRTPKFQVAERRDRWQRSSYVLSLEPMVVAEMVAAVYALVAVAVAWWQGNWWTIPFLLIYACGFGCMVLVGSGQAMAARSPRRRRARFWRPFALRSGRGSARTRNGFRSPDFVKSQGR